MTLYSNPCCADTLDQLKAAREKYIENYRVHGQLDGEKALTIENGLKALEKDAEGKLLAQMLLELATVQRITNQFEMAIGTYERAVAAARDAKDEETGFDAWMGLARSHAYGTRNHGAAEAAYDHAAACAGSTPTPKQIYDMADYASQLQVGWGELDSALLNGLDAVKFSQDKGQRFYALLDTGDVLQKFAESCDYRKLIDARSSDENDQWGACRRAAVSARSYYEQARRMADKLGWKFLEQQAQGMSKAVDVRLLLLNEKAQFEQLAQSGTFSAQHAADVLVNENFSPGGSGLPAGLPFDTLLEQAMSGARPNDPRSIYLRGVKADLDANTGQAVDYYKKAVALLAVERASLFDDLRHSGTVVENRPELIVDLGLRLLKLRQFDEAFVVFESLHSQGLQWLSAAFKRNNFTDDERKWIADLVQLDSSISARQNILVEAVIAGMKHSQSEKLLDELYGLRRQRVFRQRDKQAATIMERLKATESRTATLAQLKDIVTKTGIPVLLYWVTPTNVIVWAVSPAGVEVKTVFLPEPALVDKVSKIRNSSQSGNQSFDEKSAKELYAYLIKPFAHYLDRKQVVIVPQGALVSLSFEALIDAEDSTFLAQKTAVSYAPNAAFAIRALIGQLPENFNITALYDEIIENDTHEIKRVKDIKGILLTARPSKGMSAEETLKILGGAGMVHVLLHGKYNYDDPLQSTIAFGGNPHAEYITAAQLLAADWRHTQLAIFSSCEGALVKTRISNEQFGISWALLAGGAEQVMLSRWRVDAESNAVWMEAFYMSLVAEKMSPALAANAAMRKMINSDKRHPYYWAGPQLFGR